MQVILDIPDELVHIVIRILEERKFPDDDDGITDVIVMRDLDIDVEQFVRADHAVDEILNTIKNKYISEKTWNLLYGNQ